MSLKLVKTCERCPEQYDVLLNGEKVAYIRLRFGNLIAEIGGKEVYYHKFDNEFKGEFETDTERQKYLSEILEVLNEQICKTI
jgi:hypothetical protein